MAIRDCDSRVGHCCFGGRRGDDDFGMRDGREDLSAMKRRVQLTKLRFLTKAFWTGRTGETIIDDVLLGHRLSPCATLASVIVIGPGARVKPCNVDEAAGVLKCWPFRLILSRVKDIG